MSDTNQDNNQQGKNVEFYSSLVSGYFDFANTIEANEMLGHLSGVTGKANLALNVANNIKDYKDGNKDIPNIVLDTDIAVAVAYSYKQEVSKINADISLKPKERVGKIAVASTKAYLVASIITETADQMIDSWNESNADPSVFIDMFAEKSRNIEFNGLVDYLNAGKITLSLGSKFADSEWGTILGDAIFGTLAEVTGTIGDTFSDIFSSDDINGVSQSSQTAQSGTRQTIRRDPLTLDLDNDGIETIAADGSVKFDGNADGIKRGTGWVSGDDALLVRDVDGSGQIENGRELFGDATVKRNGEIATDGFDALRDLDSSGDGIFDANDEAFDEVQVWQDANSDGISQADELRSLAEAGIASINLDATTTTTATDGGIISKTGSYTRTDGTTASIGNLDFNQNAIYREYVNKLDTSAFAGMMSMAGIGEVRDLQESATLNTNLADLLGQMNTENYTSKLGLADDLLSEWKNTSDFSDTTNLETVTLADGTSFKFDISDSTRAQLDKLQVLETFSSNKLMQTNLNGETLTITAGSKSRNYTIVRGQENVLTDGHFTAGWTRYRDGWTNVTDLNLTSINSGYNTLLTNIKENIFAQTEYPKILENLQFEFNAETSEIEVNFDGVNQLGMVA